MVDSMIEVRRRLMTPAELAEYLNVPVGWCWKAAREGWLPHIRLPGGRKFIRFDKDAVVEALRQHECADGARRTTGGHLRQPGVVI